MGAIMLDLMREDGVVDDWTVEEFAAGWAGPIFLVLNALWLGVVALSAPFGRATACALFSAQLSTFTFLSVRAMSFCLTDPDTAAEEWASCAAIVLCVLFWNSAALFAQQDMLKGSLSVVEPAFNCGQAVLGCSLGPAFFHEPLPPPSPGLALAGTACCAGLWLMLAPVKGQLEGRVVSTDAPALF